MHVFDQPNSLWDVINPHIWSQCQMDGPTFSPYMPASLPHRSFLGWGQSRFSQFLSKTGDQSRDGVRTHGMCLNVPSPHGMSPTLTYGPNAKWMGQLSPHTCQLHFHTGAFWAGVSLVFHSFCAKLVTKAGMVYAPKACV